MRPEFKGELRAVRWDVDNFCSRVITQEDMVQSTDYDCFPSHTEAVCSTTTLAGHTEAVLCIQFHPTHPTCLASGSDDRTIQLWTLPVALCCAMFWSRTHHRQAWFPAAGRECIATVLLIGEALCREDADAALADAGGSDGGSGWDGGCGGGGDAASAPASSSASSATAPSASAPQSVRLEPLPTDIWLCILEFVRVADLCAEPRAAGGGRSTGGARAPPALERAVPPAM